MLHSAPAFWIVAGLIIAALEMVIPGSVIIWFGVAAVVTGIASFFISNPGVQWGLFTVLSVVLVLASQLIARRITKPEPEPTGANRLQNARGRVIADIRPAEMGRVKVLGEEWRACLRAPARATTGTDAHRQATADTGLAAGSPVRVLEVIGTHLVVEPLEE